MQEHQSPSLEKGDGIMCCININLSGGDNGWWRRMSIRGKIPKAKAIFVVPPTPLSLSTAGGGERAVVVAVAAAARE